MPSHTLRCLGIVALALSGCPDAVESGAVGEPVGSPCAADEECASGYCNATCATPTAPTAVIDGPRVVVVGVTANLDGAGSSASKEGPVTHAWTLTTRPGGAAATLSTADQTQTALTPDVAGVYDVQLVVSDGDLTSAPASHLLLVLGAEGELPKTPDGDPCAVDVECASGLCDTGACGANGPPVAAVGAPVFVDPGERVTLDASASSDPDGDPLTYFWQMRQAPAGSVAVLDTTDGTQPSFTADLSGTYAIDLWVNDGMLSSTSATQVVIADALYAGPGHPTGSPCTLDGECASKDCDAGTCKANAPPIADAGPLQYVVVGATVQLDGAQSYDPEGGTLTYEWGILEAPEGSTAQLDASAVVSTTFTADRVGVFLVRLVVNDGVHSSAPAIVTIASGISEIPGAQGDPCTANTQCASLICAGEQCVDNQPPTADAGVAQLVYVGDLVTLDGSGSVDPDGQPLLLSWLLVDAPAGSAVDLSLATDPASPELVADVAGLFLFELTVSDGLHTDSATVVVVAEPALPSGEVGDPCGQAADCVSGDCASGSCAANQRPVAVIAPPAAAAVGATIALDGSGSTDPDGDPLTYSWELVAAPASSGAQLANGGGPSTALTTDAPGQYVVMLRVSDGKLDSAPATVELEIEPNQAPVAELTWSVADPAPLGGALTLDGTASFDSDGDALSYTWSLILAPSGSAATPVDGGDGAASIAVDASGYYVVEVTVSDGALDDSKVAAIPVTLEAYPQAIIAGDTAGGRTCAVTLDGTGSTPPDGYAIASYQWTFESHNGEFPCPGCGYPLFIDDDGNTVEVASGATPWFVPETVGSYKVRLTVTGTNGNQHTTEASIQVSEPDAILDFDGMLDFWDGQPAPMTMFYVTDVGYTRLAFQQVPGGGKSASASAPYDLWTTRYDWGDPGPPAALGQGNDALRYSNVRAVYGQGLYHTVQSQEMLLLPRCYYSDAPVSWPMFFDDLGPGMISAQVDATVGSGASTVYGVFPDAKTIAMTFTPMGQTTPLPGPSLVVDPDAGLLVDMEGHHLVYNSGAPSVGWSPPTWSAPVAFFNGVLSGDSAGFPPVWTDLGGDVADPSHSDLRSVHMVSNGTDLWLALTHYGENAPAAYHVDIWTGRGFGGLSAALPGVDLPDPSNPGLHVALINAGGGAWTATLYASTGGAEFVPVASDLPTVALTDGVEVRLPMDAGDPSLASVLDGANFRVLACASQGPDSCSSDAIFSEAAGDGVMPPITLDASQIPIPPTAVITTNGTPFVGCEFRAYGFDSFDADGSIQSHVWELIETPPGSTTSLDGSGAAKSFVPDVDGVYTLQLIVVDDDGTASAPAVVTVDASTPGVSLPASTWNEIVQPGAALWYVSADGFDRLTLADGGALPTVDVYRETLDWEAADITMPAHDGAPAGPGAVKWDTWTWSDRWGLSSSGVSGAEPMRRLIPSCLDSSVPNVWTAFEDGQEVTYSALITQSGLDFVNWQGWDEYFPGGVLFPTAHEVTIDRTAASGSSSTAFIVSLTGPYGWPGGHPPGTRSHELVAVSGVGSEWTPPEYQAFLPDHCPYVGWAGPRQVHTAAATIDGDPADWVSGPLDWEATNYGRVWTDLRGDAVTQAPGNDLAGLDLASDGVSLDGYIQVHDPPVATLSRFALELRASPKANTHGDVSIGLVHDGLAAWEVELLQYDQGLGGGLGGYVALDASGAAVMETPSGLEFSVPLDIGAPSLSSVVNGRYFQVSSCEGPVCMDRMQPLNTIAGVPTTTPQRLTDESLAAWQKPQYGASVALDGDTLVFAAAKLPQNGAYLYTAARDPLTGTWSTPTEIAATYQPTHRLALAGDTLLATEPGISGAQNNGTPILDVVHVYTYDPVAEVWSDGSLGGVGGFEVASVTAGALREGAIALSTTPTGDTVAVGAAYDDPGGLTGAGSVVIFGRDPDTGVWTQQSSVTPSNPEAGERFGWALSYADDRLVVGAPYEYNPAGAGRVLVFERDPTSGQWTETATLTASDGAPGDYFGKSVSMVGTTVAVGAPRPLSVGMPPSSSEGRVHIFTYDPGAGVWTETASLTGSGGFGHAVALTPQPCPAPGPCPLTLAVGAPVEHYKSGRVHLFHQDLATGGWSAANVIAPVDGAPHDYFGASLAVDDLASGGLAVGSPGDNNNGVINAGSVTVYDIPAP